MLIDPGAVVDDCRAARGRAAVGRCAGVAANARASRTRLVRVQRRSATRGRAGAAKDCSVCAGALVAADSVSAVHAGAHGSTVGGVATGGRGCGRPNWCSSHLSRHQSCWSRTCWCRSACCRRWWRSRTLALPPSAQPPSPPSTWPRRRQRCRRVAAGRSTVVGAVAATRHSSTVAASPPAAPPVPAPPRGAAAPPVAPLPPPCHEPPSVEPVHRCAPRRGRATSATVADATDAASGTSSTRFRRYPHVSGVATGVRARSSSRRSTPPGRSRWTCSDRRGR